MLRPSSGIFNAAICMMFYKRGKDGVTDAEQRQLSLLDLPHTAIALVAEHSKPSGYPLLELARECRDAVLSQTRKISLKIISNLSSSAAPTAGLLDRACCTAPSGLHLDLDLSGQHDVLALLLMPAVERPGGWPKVHKLTAHLGNSSYVHLMGPAMPALRHLEVALHNWELGDAGFFSSLQLCTHLTALHLRTFIVRTDTAAVAAAAALARLTNLRELGLRTASRCHVCPSTLVKHLTALTSLCLHNNSFRGEHSSAPLYAAAAKNPGLQSFSVDICKSRDVPEAPLQQLLEACPSLTHLGFDNTCVQQNVLDVLLTHGTNITSLTASCIKPNSSIAAREVSWRKLVLTNDDHPTALHLANLPLQSVTSLQLSEDPDAGLGRLELPISSVPSDQLPGLLLQATSNLARCPAWRSKPESWVTLVGDPDFDDEDGDDVRFLTPDQRLGLLQALAPLHGPHVGGFELGIKGFDVTLGTAEVMALAESLGQGLVELKLSHVTLSAGFWAALDHALPALHTLTLDEQVGCCPVEVGIFCGRRDPGRRTTLKLGRGVYKLCGGSRFKEGLKVQGLSHVKVRKLHQ